MFISKPNYSKLDSKAKAGVSTGEYIKNPISIRIGDINYVLE